MGALVEALQALLQALEDTVLRDWKLAKVWLLRELKGSKSDGS